MANSISGISLESALGDKIRSNSNANATSTTSSTTSTTGSNISSLQQQIAQSQQTIDQASELQQTNNGKIEELEKEVEALKKQIVEEMQNAINEGQAFSEEQQNHINDAVTLTVAKYLKGEISKDELMTTLSSNLATTESDMATKLNSLIEGKSEFVDKIESKIGQICDLAKQNDELSKKIQDEAAKISSCQQQIAAEQAASSGCCDPIGFETEDAQFDFIIDRDNDGEFDNEQEFLGAKNGFDEMKALDTDGNGVVEGEELNTVKLVKTDKKAGTQSFVTAAEAGVTKIDLASYEKTGFTQANGNEHVGKFNVEAQGKTIEGYQTLDKTDYLKANYGNAYGKSMNSSESFAQKTEPECPKVAEVSTEAKQLKASAEKAQKEAISYKDVKDLNADAERKAVDNGIASIKKTTETGIYNNANLFANETGSLKSEEERDKELAAREGKNDKEAAEKSESKPSTTQFMSMAYAFQAQDSKKKLENQAA